jgi:hypothetical protein
MMKRLTTFDYLGDGFLLLCDEIPRRLGNRHLSLTGHSAQFMDGELIRIVSHPANSRV